MPVVFFDTNALYIEGYRDSFAAGTLVADFTPEGLGVRVLHGTEYLVNAPWAAYTRLDGTGFASPCDLMAYLQGEFTKRRPLGIPAASATASDDLPAGIPVCISRLDGTLQAARADTYALAFVVGLLAAPATAGFIGTATGDALILDDWTAVTGSPVLSVGQPYFLGLAGGLTTTPDLTAGHCLVRVGNATGPHTFAPIQADPILL